MQQETPQEAEEGGEEEETGTDGRADREDVHGFGQRAGRGVY